MAGETVEKWRKVWERDDETEAPLTAPWESLSWGREQTAGSGDSRRLWGRGQCWRETEGELRCLMTILELPSCSRFILSSSFCCFSISCASNDVIQQTLRVKASPCH